jgi:hypothetical protein
MGGFLGIGGSSAKTDRSNQLNATSGEYQIFNQGLPAGQASQAAGQADISQALSGLGLPADYYKSLLTAGRTSTAASAAPAINAEIGQNDTQRRAEATFGTSRTGGAAAKTAEASEGSKANIDNIISTQLQTGRKEGAQGLQDISKEQAGIGSVELSNAMAQLGLSQDAINSILNNATTSRMNSTQIAQQEGEGIGQLAGLALGFV